MKRLSPRNDHLSEGDSLGAIRNEVQDGEVVVPLLNQGALLGYIGLD
jgi:hypothetical protein